MITSKDNAKIKYLRKLNQKKHRDKEGVFLVFGSDLVNEALIHGDVVEIFTKNKDIEGTLISSELFDELDPNISKTDVLALCNKSNKNIKSNKILILEDVQDPANVGALLRSASAFNFSHVILSNKCADIYNDKTISASKGSIFHLNIERTNIYERVMKLKEEGYTIYVTLVDGDSNISYSNKSVLVLGNEGHGVSDEMIKLADKSLTIPTNTVESLNVLVAGSILMYEGMKN